MPNSIPQRQNEPQFIDRIAASSRAYETVKLLSKLQTGLAISAAILGPAVSFIYPEAKGWAALYAIAVLLFDVVFLEPAVKRYQELGAKIQELFDTELLELPWNSHRAQSPPDPESIRSLADAFKKRESTNRLLNWYPSDVGVIPLEYARFICQRANMRWDAALRRYFATFFVVLLMLLVFIVAGIALAMKWNASDIVVSLVLPILPSALKLVREGRKHSESASISERTKSMLESIWNAAIKGDVPSEQLREESRRLQDELYDRRKSSPTVPQWLYMRLRDDYERDMRFASGEMVKKVQTTLNVQ
jgi:hypothetical protein